MRTVKISVLAIGLLALLLTGCAVTMTTSGPPDLLGIIRPTNCGCYAALAPFRGERIEVQMREQGTGTEIVRAEIVQALLQCGAVVDTGGNATYAIKAVVEYTGGSAVAHVYITRIPDGILCGSGSGWSDFYNNYYSDYRPFAFAARRALANLRLNLPQPSPEPSTTPQQ
jgi:hypothetical protein